jgi:hypothetical protein
LKYWRDLGEKDRERKTGVHARKKIDNLIGDEHSCKIFAFVSMLLPIKGRFAQRKYHKQNGISKRDAPVQVINSEQATEKTKRRADQSST